MAKDVNINVKARGAHKAKQDLDGVADASRKVGDQTAQAGQKGAEGTEQATQKMGAMGRMVNSLKQGVAKMLLAWAGAERVIAWLQGIAA